MNHVELIVNVEPQELGSDILIAELSEIEFESFVESETGFYAYIKEDSYSEINVKKLFLNYSHILKISYISKIIEKQNWAKEWESNYQAIDVDGKCSIRAPFHEKKKNIDYDIIIEPKMSFGTGHHNTTQLMIKKLLKLNLNNKSLLDIGCGTGVLAILASMLGANPITAIDIDDWCYENSIENLQKNNIKNVAVYKGDSKILNGKSFNTILANINKNVLLSDMKVYNNSLEQNGNLVLSGFFETDIIEINKSAADLGLKMEEKLIIDEWAMLHFKK